jgi:hypothetical protein
MSEPMRIAKVRMTLFVDVPDAPLLITARDEREFLPVQVRVFVYENGKCGSELLGRHVRPGGMLSPNICHMPYQREKPEFQLQAERLGRDFLAEAMNAWEVRDA